MRSRFFRTAGSIRAPKFIFQPGEVRHAMAFGTMSLTVAVVERSDGSLVLVDCGHAEEVCANPSAVLGVLGALASGLEATADDALVRQLVELGYDPSRVTHIIATHLHADHVGAIKDFPNAELVVSRNEFDAFLSVPRRPGYRKQDLVDAGRLRLVDLKGERRFGFPGSFDLFGDGEVVLLDANGHTRGAVAVAIDDGTRPYIHIGDAAYQSWEYGLAPAGPSRLSKITVWNEPALHETYRILRDAENLERRPILVPAHDNDVYLTLPHDAQG
jgi:glyoxylase-like metal-dependent hydrolase (beta-lactamase superfamily II)